MNGQGDSYIPPKLCGGIKISKNLESYSHFLFITQDKRVKQNFSLKLCYLDMACPPMWLRSLHRPYNTELRYQDGCKIQTCQSQQKWLANISLHFRTSLTTTCILITSIKQSVSSLCYIYMSVNKHVTIHVNHCCFLLGEACSLLLKCY